MGFPFLGFPVFSQRLQCSCTLWQRCWKYCNRWENPGKSQKFSLISKEKVNKGISRKLLENLIPAEFPQNSRKISMNCPGRTETFHQRVSAGRAGTRNYHPFQNHYIHKITIFELFRGLQFQLSGLSRINLHYKYSFLVLVAERSYRK